MNYYRTIQRRKQLGQVTILTNQEKFHL